MTVLLYFYSNNCSLGDQKILLSKICLKYYLLNSSVFNLRCSGLEKKCSWISKDIFHEPWSHSVFDSSGDHSWWHWVVPGIQRSSTAIIATRLWLMSALWRSRIMFTVRTATESSLHLPVPAATPRSWEYVKNLLTLHTHAQTLM